MKRIFTFIGCALLIVVSVSISCQKELECFDCFNNKPPIAIAGIDQKITLPIDSVLLDGSASGDADGKINNWLWTKIKGPASFVMVNTNATTTMVKNLIAGVYSFELKITDDKGAAAKDTVQIVVESPAANRPPVACAGADQSALPANPVRLNGSCSTDPDNNINTYNWSNISGPSTTIIDSVNVAVTQVSGLVQGVYQFELKVTDAGGLSSKDTMKLTVNAATVVINCGESNRPTINANLIPFGKLSEPGNGVAVASAGNKIVFAGASISGNPAGYGSSKVDIFDIVAQTWSTANLSVRRADVSAVAAGNKIFFAGGRLGEGGNDQHFSTVDIYDVSTNKWSVTSLSQSRAYIASATVGDKVFFAGGEREWPHPVSDRIDIYDLGTDSWTTASLRVPRSGITAVTANNRIYFAGGSNQLGGTDNVESIVDIYDNTASSWSTTNLREPKTFFAGINVRGKIYWAGGYNRSGEPTCNVEIRDLATQTSSTAFLSQPFTYVVVEGQNAVVKDDKIIWFATLDPLTGNSTDKFNMYDLTTNRWLTGLLPVKISGASVISVNNIIYVAGGSVNGRMSDQVWKLEF